MVLAAAAASQAGHAVIATTDSRASPLAASARHGFFIPHENSFFSNRVVAHPVFREGLLNPVVTKLGRQGLDTLEAAGKL